MYPHLQLLKAAMSFPGLCSCPLSLQCNSKFIEEVDFADKGYMHALQALMNPFPFKF